LATGFAAGFAPPSASGCEACLGGGEGSVAGSFSFMIDSNGVATKDGRVGPDRCRQQGQGQVAQGVGAEEEASDEEQAPDGSSVDQRGVDRPLRVGSSVVGELAYDFLALEADDVSLILSKTTRCRKRIPEDGEIATTVAGVTSNRRW